VETHLSQVGGAVRIGSRGRANGTQNPVDCHPWRENEEGVKIIPAHNYAGVDTFFDFHCGALLKAGKTPHFTMLGAHCLVVDTASVLPSFCKSNIPGPLS
jgi:hypothetical protein